MQIQPIQNEYEKEIVDLILNIQQKEFNDGFKSSLLVEVPHGFIQVKKYGKHGYKP